MRCWDCGSTLVARHTILCEMAGPREASDLPAHPGTQHWTGDPAPVPLQEMNRIRADHDMPHARRAFAPRG